MENFKKFELEIDFRHAISAVMDALQHSDNVTESEMKMVNLLLLKAKATSEPIRCPNCGSIHVGIVDYEPLSLHEELKEWGQYDTELYGKFKCFFCKRTFKKVLEISHQ
jgi:DNA-directed RNA polymerase subunit RPC12/RpoP